MFPDISQEYRKEGLVLNRNKTMEIGAAYVRVSTNDQTELSPDAQLREIKKAAKADGILIRKNLYL